jgi:hypothetical protein
MVTRPNSGSPTDKSSEQLLAEALRARAGGTPGIRRPPASTGYSRPPDVRRPPLTVAQLVLAALIAGVVVGILLAVLSLV